MRQAFRPILGAQLTLLAPKSYIPGETGGLSSNYIVGGAPKRWEGPQLTSIPLPIKATPALDLEGTQNIEAGLLAYFRRAMISDQLILLAPAS